MRRERKLMKRKEEPTWGAWTYLKLVAFFREHVKEISQAVP